MKRGPQRIDLRDHSTACPIGLYFMQDDDSDDDDVQKINSGDQCGHNNVSAYGRP